jgi:DNA-directed RNA polymerase subunit K/omega
MDTENPQTTEANPAEPRVSAPPIHNRFLFVDIAALRAKQLRRGALPRLQDGGDLKPSDAPHKAERVAMEEVRRGLVQYDVPVPKGVAGRA